jgi:hypothetical protein
MIRYCAEPHEAITLTYAIAGGAKRLPFWTARAKCMVVSTCGQATKYLPSRAKLVRLKVTIGRAYIRPSEGRASVPKEF